MRNLLALVGAAVVAFLAVGYYLGWYQVSRAPNASGKQSIQVDINANKVTEDVKLGVEKGGAFVESFRDKPKDGQPQGPATNFFTPTAAEKEKESPISSEKPKNTLDVFGRPTRN